LRWGRMMGGDGMEVVISEDGGGGSAGFGKGD
jgi:hypothetical protein